jgi:hypothetical protein
MGRSFSRSNGTRLMDRRRKVSIHKLERILKPSSFPYSPFPPCAIPPS